MPREHFRELEDKIHYCFKDKSLIELAMSHSSYANEKHLGKLGCNERLEFLGDAVLEIVSSDFLFHRFPDMPEGDLTKTRASMVCEPTLAYCAEQIGLGGYLLLGKGEDATGGRTRNSVVSDAMEALIGAIYLDGGIESARAFVLPFVKEMLEDESRLSFKDYKTILQEIVQQNPEEKLQYKLVEEKGPDHNKRFVVDVMLNSNVIGTGEGRSKKNAEQMAAKEALQLMGR